VHSAGESEENLALLRLIDEQYTKTPFYGSPRMTVWLRGLGHPVNVKRVARLMQTLGLEAIYPRPKTSVPGAGTDHQVYPYLLRGVSVERADQVWSTDITYIRMPQGFLYLVAVMDWFSRYVLSWEVSNTLDAFFCREALERALEGGRRPQVFNSDQGAQFTSRSFTGRLEREGIAISMDGRGRYLDNIFVERLWRSVKYEEVYLKDYQSVAAAVAGLGGYFAFYNQERPHQSLDYRTPEAVYRESVS
jgi:putative transposase